MIVLSRMTRLNEGPGEKHEGRRSSTPIVYQGHLEGCSRVLGAKPLTEAQAASIVRRDCSKPRHLMTCLACDSEPVVRSVRDTAF